MPTITLPDGSQKSFDEALSGAELAAAIGPGLARKAIGLKIDGSLCDLGTRLEHDCQVAIVTARDEDPEALYLLRHSCAHVLAEAVCTLLPGTRLAYGPPIDDGFYYDLATPRPVTPEDFPAIEAKMAEIVAADRPFSRIECDRASGLARVEGDLYKTDNAQRALERGSDRLSFYATGVPGSDWEDLCAGPHVPSTRWLANFKLMSVAGAYWHGDHSSDQLTRIYGTCFADKKALAAHLQRIEEAKRRDHRRLGKELDLFHIDEDNPGQIYWHPKGWTLYRAVQEHIRRRLEPAGYVEVNTPALQPQSLWERSGHWAKYRQNMFVTHEQLREHAHAQDVDFQGEKPFAFPAAGEKVKLFSLKPMNCPGHIEIFRNRLRSYRDLPLRMAEFGSCVRYEPSGALHGIMRVRGFVQDDAHIFCTEEQVGSEVVAFCELLKQVYRDFGFDADNVEVLFSTRPETRVGSDEVWDRSEAALAAACDQAGLKYVLSPGEGAFYGPKLEFTLVDSLGRGWQCGTIQIDFMLCSAERLDASYVAEDGSRQHPVLLHRAILGSLERFIGILIEHYAGKFPLWLAPEQIRVLPITDAQLAYAGELVARLQSAGLRATVCGSSEKLGAKIRDARNDRVPYFAVVGAAEVESGSVALQRQDGSKLGSVAIEALIEQLHAEVEARS